MTDLELYHYGVKGMKWGVRRFQDMNGRLTNSGKKRYLDKSSKNTDDSDDAGKIKLTDNQKKAIKIGAAVAGASLVAYGAYKLSSNKIGKLENVGKLEIDKIFASKGLKIQENPVSSIPEQIKAVNPTKSTSNCRACAIASILRLRGYDVEASSSVDGGYLDAAVRKCFKGAKLYDLSNPNQTRVVEHLLQNFENGSSGAIGAQFKTQYGVSGHAFNWSIKDGVVTFFDGQKGLGDCSNYFDLIDSSAVAEIVRLDNLEIRPRGVLKYVNNR